MGYLNGLAEVYYTDSHQEKNWIKSIADLLNIDCVEKIIEAYVHLKTHR